MDIFTLVGKMTLEGQDKVNQGLTKTEERAQKVAKGLRVMGAAFTAVGAAGLAIVQSTKKINAQLGVTATNLGVTTKEMRDLTLATTNVTFPIKEVTASFDLLARAGVKDIEVLKATATAFDTLGDATGYSASQVTGFMVPAMKTFGLSAEEMAKKTDIMTYMSRESTMTMADFNTMVGYTTPELVQAGLTMDDLTAALIYMERQGYAPGRVMTREFMKATTLATKEQIPLTEALGMTSQELEGIRAELSGATGMTQEYADAANKQYTLMDKLKQKWSELTLGASGFLEPLEPILAGMTALGPLMIALSTSQGMAAASAVAHGIAMAVLHPLLTAKIILIKALTAAQWLWNVAMTANPIGLIIVGIGALIAAGIALWKNWDKVSAFFVKMWSNIKIAFGHAVKFIVKTVLQPFLLYIDKFLGTIVRGVAMVVGIFNKDWAESINKVADTMQNLGQEITDWADRMIESEKVKKVAQKVEDSFEDMGGNVISVLDKVGEAAEDLADTFDLTTDEMLDDIRDLTDEAKDAARDRTRAEIDAIDDRMRVERDAHRERMDALQEEYDETIRVIDAELSYALKGYQNQLDAIDDQLDAISDAERQERDAERKADLEARIAAETDVDRRADLEDDLNKLLIKSDNKQWQDERKLAYEARIAEETDVFERVRLEAELAEFLLGVQRERTKQQLTDEKDAIRERMELAREEARSAKDRAREEYEYEQELLEQKFEDFILRLESEKTSLDLALEEQLARYDADLKAFEELLSQEIEDTENFVAQYNALMAQLRDKVVTVTTVHRDVYVGTGRYTPPSRPSPEPPPWIQPEAPGLPPPGYPPGEEWFQKGGIFDFPQVIGVGEKGPEAVIPLSRESLERLGLTGGGPEAGTVNNYFQGPWFIREEADIQKLARELERLRLEKVRALGG